MKYAFVCVAVLLVGFFVCGCVQVPSPLPGIVYANITSPSYYDAGSNSGPGPKTGRSKAATYMALWATGDASVEAACKDGGITKINTVDQKYKNVMMLYGTFETIVTGE